MSAQGNSARAIVVALLANFAIFVSKLGAALLTGSGSMLAEAVHSLSDCGNQGLLLYGMRHAKRPPTPEFPLGYGRALYFWSFLVALLLFSIGGVFSIYEGLHKLDSPEPLRWAWVAVGVLTFGLLAEAFSMRACIMEVNKARGDKSLWRWFRTSRQAELIVIFGEDLAALVGLALALIAVLATMITGDPRWDAIGSISIGVLLMLVAVFVANQVKSLLIGQSVDPQLRQEIALFLDARPEIERVLNVIAMQMGPDIMLAVKIKMHGDPPASQLIDLINVVEADLKQRFTEVRWSFFEPDHDD